MIWVTSFRLLGPHRLWVQFNDGRSGELTWRDRVMGPMSAPLADPAFFARARLNSEFGVLEWPNGFDVAPEYLYFLAFEHDPELQALFRSWGYLADEAATAAHP
jgi:hypothetical protein